MQGRRAKKGSLPGFLHCPGGVCCLDVAEVITQGELGKQGGKRLTETGFSSTLKMQREPCVC